MSVVFCETCLEVCLVIGTMAWPVLAMWGVSHGNRGVVLIFRPYPGFDAEHHSHRRLYIPLYALHASALPSMSSSTMTASSPTEYAVRRWLALRNAQRPTFFVQMFGRRFAAPSSADQAHVIGCSFQRGPIISRSAHIRDVSRHIVFERRSRCSSLPVQVPNRYNLSFLCSFCSHREAARLQSLSCD